MEERIGRDVQELPDAIDRLLKDIEAILEQVEREIKEREK
jgi:outer membrane murein-binding lipoprotein Lpp